MIFYMQIKEKKYGDSVYKHTVSEKKNIQRGKQKIWYTFVFSILVIIIC